MLPITSKYKIAKRLGAQIFEKTQSQKFALSEARTTKKPKRGGRGGGSDYGRQLLEKQKVRFTYSITEGKLAAYAEKAYVEKNPAEALHRMLERRLDSVAYRAGFARTRRGARQMTSHGHILVNGVRVMVPSYETKKGDIITVREGSRSSALFSHLGDPETAAWPVPNWLAVDNGLMKIEVTGLPPYTPSDVPLDYAAVFEFYSR